MLTMPITRRRLPLRLTAPLLIGLGLGGCHSGPTPHTLATWMDGSFSSEAQSQADQAYFDIRLHMHRIWEARTDGPWLYVEQARGDLLDKPYRQRIYRLSRRDQSTFVSDVYTLPEPVARFTGAWDPANPASKQFDTLTPADLTLLQGCGVVLKWSQDKQQFIGGTEGTDCASTRQGAKYTTSEIIFTKDLLTSWDRGFDAAGKQVWGAEKGGYQFERR